MLINEDLKKILLTGDTEDISVQLILSLENKDKNFYFNISEISFKDNNFYITEKNKKAIIISSPSKLLSKIILAFWSDKGFLKGVKNISDMRSLFYPPKLKEVVENNPKIDLELKIKLEKNNYNIPYTDRKILENLTFFGENGNLLGRYSELFLEKINIGIKTVFDIRKDLSFEEVIKYTKVFPAHGNIPACTFMVIRGNELLKNYNSSNFYRPITSCMSGDGAREFIRIYAENPEKVALGIIIDNVSKKVMARQLIWNSDQGFIVMDRRYMYDIYLSNYLDEVCLDCGLYYRANNSNSRQLFYKGKLIEKNFSITVKDVNNRLPYLDTFFYVVDLINTEKKLFGNNQKYVRLNMSPSQIGQDEIGRCKIGRSTGGTHSSTFNFNINELLPWEIIELIIAGDRRVSTGYNPFNNQSISFEMRNRICEVRKDLIQSAIWNWSYSDPQDSWMKFLEKYPKYREEVDFKKLQSNQIAMVFNHCVNIRDFKLIKLCLVKNMTNRDFHPVLENALRLIGPAELMDRCGLKFKNPVVRMNNKIKKTILLNWGERHILDKEKEPTQDHLVMANLFLLKLKKSNFEEVIKSQPFWKELVPENFIPREDKKKTKDENVVVEGNEKKDDVEKKKTKKKKTIIEDEYDFDDFD